MAGKVIHGSDKERALALIVRTALPEQGSEVPHQQAKTTLTKIAKAAKLRNPGRTVETLSKTD